MFMAARGSFNYIHPGDGIWYAEGSKPLDVSQWGWDNPELGWEVKNYMNLGNTETCEMLKNDQQYLLWNGVNIHPLAKRKPYR